MKKWLLEQFLPMWAKESVLRDNRTLKRQLRSLEHRLQVREAYIRGLEFGLRSAGKIKRKEAANEYLQV